MRRGSVTLLLIVVVISACASEAPPEASSEPLPPGRVWFNSSWNGLTVLSSMGWRTFYEGAMVFDLDVDPQGQLWAAHFDGLAHFDGRAFAPPDESCRATVLEFDEQGRLWAGLGSGAKLLDGTQWTSFDFQDYGIDDFSTTRFRDVAIDGQGRVWAATWGDLLVFDGQDWAIHPAPAGRETVGALAIDDQGRLWAAHVGGVSLLDGSSWTTWTAEDMGLRGISSVEDITCDDRGRIWMAAPATGLLVFDGHTWTVYDTSNSGLVDNMIRAVAVDSQGRVWAGTRSGVSVFDGVNWTTYNQSNSGLVSSDVTQILIESGGMTNLPELENVRVGEMAGSVMRAGEPVVGARVLLCTSVLGTVGLGFGGDTPCSGPFQSEAVTDEGGQYAITDVPIGEYQLTVQMPDGKWFTIMAGGAAPVPKTYVVKEGATTHAGLSIAE